jgi:Zn-dependent protease
VNIDPVSIVFQFIILLFSLSFHEAAHAWTSNRFGDDTGKLLGRISMNPMVHIDPFGTILFPLIGMFSPVPVLGWAKPVPVNPLRWRDKNKANILVSAAGPISNLMLAVGFFVLLKTLIVLLDAGIVPFDPMDARAIPYAAAVARFPPNASDSLLIPLTVFLAGGLHVNIGLALFNLIPIPPLDGSHVLETILPYEAQKSYDQIRPFGMIILYGLMLFGVFGFVMGPVFSIVNFLLFL